MTRKRLESSNGWLSRKDGFTPEQCRRFNLDATAMRKAMTPSNTPDAVSRNLNDSPVSDLGVFLSGPFRVLGGEAVALTHPEFKGSFPHFSNPANYKPLFR